MNNNQITVKQHYVPRCYMKNFSIVKDSGKKEKQLIAFYQFNENLLKGNIPTESVCYKKYFYGEDGKIEKELATKETKWAEVLKDIVSTETYNLDKKQENLIKEFAIFQHCRTLAMYNHVKNMMSEFIENIISKDISDNEKNMQKEKIESELDASDVIKSCEYLIEIVTDLNISLIKFNTEKKLITSDMPIIIINPFSPRQVGIAMVGIIIFFPVSPDKLVMIYDGKVYTDCNGFMTICNEDDVINLNKYQIISAQERILAREISDLETIGKDKNLILKREENEEDRKIENGFDGIGKLLCLKTRKINYDFELSFCKLPIYLRRISKDHRESFDRKYNYDSRLAILARIYKISELVDKNPYTKDIDAKKMKKAYLELLKFMDVYWNTPNKHRIITPQLMKNLKKANTTFFK
ncbi:DUF4238 domain-containing protein [Clostridioides sp. ES-S-0001-02]|uniref:DUF4238 domain-containing protein n=1 Tax=Clostridioides sp. ES-S-0001-02 TaxID=2770770 RepID=UPI001D10144B|nr:DUF4238 domain-containing protein [Clostridioides sp. ES-S-0001-02]